MTTAQQRTILVLNRMLAMAQQNEDDAEMLAEALDEMLDDIASNDGFGTEQQCDPRGDFRNGEWSMDRVEGLDK